MPRYRLTPRGDALIGYTAFALAALFFLLGGLYANGVL